MGWISHNELEESTNTSGMEDFDSVGGHLITNEVEGEVNVLEEEGNREESVEELAWGLVLQDLHPHLHLLTVGTLHEVVRVAEVHVVWPHAAELVGSAARFLQRFRQTLRQLYMFLTSSVSGGDWASPIPRPMAIAAVQARANVFIVLKVYFASFS